MACSWIIGCLWVAGMNGSTFRSVPAYCKTTIGATSTKLLIQILPHQFAALGCPT